MPKNYSRKRSYASRRGRRTYVPQGLRLPSRNSPYASKYGDECWVKVQKVVPLQTQNANGDVFFFMRADLNLSDSVNFALSS